MKKEDKPRATVCEIDGKIVLDDPDALAMIKAVSKYNCQNTLEINAERVEYFKKRMGELGKSASEAVIVVLNVDDEHGAQIAEILMPGHDWQAIRNAGQIPFARGLASREFIQEMLDALDEEAALKLKEMGDIAVVVVDHLVAEVFPA